MRLFLILCTIVCGPKAWSNFSTPALRLNVGVFSTEATAGQVVVEEQLGSLLTIQPTILWNLSSFSSRIGVHFLGDLASQYGLMPISGIGFSGYFYPYGISSAEELTGNNVVIQKYRVSPFVYGGLTPVNFNLNQAAEGTDAAISFSSLIYEIMLGAGVDYPLKPNVLLSGELTLRLGSAAEDQAGAGEIKYSSIGLRFGITTSYF